MVDFECPNECGCAPEESCKCKCHELERLLIAEQNLEYALEDKWDDFSQEVRTEVIVAKSHLSTAIRAHLARISNDAESSV